MAAPALAGLTFQQIDAVRHGRKVVKVWFKLRLMWFAKDEQGLKST